MSAPNTFAGLFRGGERSQPKPPNPVGDIGGLILSLWDCGSIEEVERRPKWNLLVGFGGKVAGRSSELVLPVWCLELGDDSLDRVLLSYFCRMKRSMTPSTSSTSIGMDGLTLRGLCIRFEAVLPIRFMFFPLCQRLARYDSQPAYITSTCSTLH